MNTWSDVFFVLALVAPCWIFWGLSWWATEKRFDLMLKRIESLEQEPRLVFNSKPPIFAKLIGEAIVDPNFDPERTELVERKIPTEPNLEPPSFPDEDTEP